LHFEGNVIEAIGYEDSLLCRDTPKIEATNKDPENSFLPSIFHIDFESLAKEGSQRPHSQKITNSPLGDARHQDPYLWKLASRFHGRYTLLKVKFDGTVWDMKGAKPRKPLDLFSVREGYLEDIVTDLTTFP
jgi:hypothetical protein